jgi:hypothetical protein
LLGSVFLRTGGVLVLLPAGFCCAAGDSAGFTATAISSQSAIMLIIFFIVLPFEKNFD